MRRRKIIRFALLLTSLAAQSGASYTFEYQPAGFKCRLALPLEARA